MESVVQDDPLTIGALIFGQGKAQAALLVEPKPGIEDPSSLIARIWPSVEKANLHGPGQARIIRSIILIASPEKSFIRSPKGSVVRKLTLRLYESELESLYSQERVSDNQAGSILAATYSLDTIHQFVHSQVDALFPSRAMDATDDFYVSGLNSVKTVELGASLRAGMKRSGVASDPSWLSNEFIYANPTIERLSQAMHEHLNPHFLRGKKNGTSEENQRAKMITLVQKYTEGFPHRRLEVSAPDREPSFNCLLVGSTGSVGTWILHALLRNPSIGRISCLDRSADAKIRHQDIITQRKLDIILDDSKVQFLAADLHSPHFGLSEADFSVLSSQVNFIIHNAWTVDFNLSLESFEQVHLRGIRNPVDFSLNSPRDPHLFFISSIASVSRWSALHNPTIPVPELPIFDSSLAPHLGYAESKNVAEQILDIAHTQSGLKRSILRLGNIAGPFTLGHGAWNEREWLPSLLKTSKATSKLPDHIPDADLIPINVLADIVLEIVLDALVNHKQQVYNIVNPHRTKWGTLMEPVRGAIGDDCVVVSPDEWIQAVEGSADNKEPLRERPTLKILEFTKGALGGDAQKYETGNAKAASGTFAALGPVTREWMGVWLEQWGY